MRLTFEGNVFPKEMYTDILQKSFKIICDELGIAHYDSTIHLTLHKYGEAPTNGSGGVASWQPDICHFHMFMIAMPIGCMLKILSHEMVHVKQRLTGELKIDCEKMEIFFQGEQLNPERISMLQQLTAGTPFAGMVNGILPYEKEAYERMKEIAQKTIKKLPSHMQEYIQKGFGCACVEAGICKSGERPCARPGL